MVDEMRDGKDEDGGEESEERWVGIWMWIIGFFFFSNGMNGLCVTFDVLSCFL